MRIELGFLHIEDLSVVFIFKYEIEHTVWMQCDFKAYIILKWGGMDAVFENCFVQLMEYAKNSKYVNNVD